MAREKEGYRDNLARIDAAYPDKELLSLAEVSRYLGVHRETAGKLLKGKMLPGNKISKVTLARAIS